MQLARNILLLIAGVHCRNQTAEEWSCIVNSGTATYTKDSKDLVRTSIMFGNVHECRNVTAETISTFDSFFNGESGSSEFRTCCFRENGELHVTGLPENFIPCSFQTHFFGPKDAEMFNDAKVCPDLYQMGLDLVGVN